MSVKVQVFVGCDVKRSAGCVGRHDVVASNGTAGIVRARQEAEAVGWTQEQHGDQLLDACHVCSVEWMLGYRHIGYLPARHVSPDGPKPKNIGEAADWNRWQALQEEKLRGQR